MALLTNPSTGDGKFTKILISNGELICILIYILGITWFFALAHRSFNNGTYFSENALLPGLVQGEFDEDVMGKKLYLELNEVMQSNPNSIPYDWLFDKFSEMSFDVYFHNFTLHYPFAQNTTYHGKNIYAVLRAPRSSSTEGLVITAPFRSLDSAHPDNSASIAIMLALAKFCRRHMYWAKDIIFLITDHEQLGTQEQLTKEAIPVVTSTTELTALPVEKPRLRFLCLSTDDAGNCVVNITCGMPSKAWLEAYHNIQLGNGILNHGNIISRAGSIQAAINLEFHSTKISHIDVKIEGLNGQLPNLDLANLVHRLCKNEGIRHTFKNRNNPRKKDSQLQQWYYSLTTLMSMVLTQASCVPNGNHGLYHRFGIEAVTLEGYEPPENYRKHVSGFRQIGRVLEGILRSLNNLLERFHQSYFFYLLPGNDRFIPIGSYMPSVSLIGAPLLIKGLTTWLKIYSYLKPKTGSKSKEGSEAEGEGKVERSELRFTVIGAVLLFSHLSGWLFANSSSWLARTGFDLAGFSPKHSIYVGFFLFFIFSLNNASLFSISSVESKFVNVIALLELATLFLIVAMHNFSLSFILSAIYVPCVCFTSSKNGRIKKLARSLYMVLIHPFVLAHLTILCYTYMTQGEENIFAKTFSATQHSFVYLNIDDMIYGNWFMKAVFGFLVPNWVLFWISSR